MKLITFTISKRTYGGNIWERFLREVLDAHFDHRRVDLSFRLNGFYRLIEAPRYLAQVAYYSLFPGGFLIRNFQSGFVPLARGKGLTIIFHFDDRFSPFLSRCFQRVAYRLFLLFNRKDSPIVVIAKYWKAELERLGFTNVHVVDNPFHLEQYVVSPQELIEFKRKHSLGSRPIIYIGNPQSQKGTDLVYQALKDQGYDLVCSGEGDLDLPVRGFRCSFNDYVKLLSACDVVITFSRFKEGWCRVAHEALLCGTPVIGSGRGAMTELLEAAGQQICDDVNMLPELVKKLLAKGKILPESTINYVRSFSFERFESRWLELINRFATPLNECSPVDRTKQAVKQTVASSQPLPLPD